MLQQRRHYRRVVKRDCEQQRRFAVCSYGIGVHRAVLEQRCCELGVTVVDGDKQRGRDLVLTKGAVVRVLKRGARAIAGGDGWRLQRGL
eukprot:4534502-Prymnesium_polylepis.1